MSARRAKESSDPARAPGLQLPSGHSASSLLYELLRDAQDREPDALGGVELPQDARRFRADFAESLVRFETARVRSPRRAEIARDLVSDAERRLIVRSPDGELSLDEYWAEPARPLPTEELRLGGDTQLAARVPCFDQIFAGKELGELADEFLARGLATRAAARALRWIGEREAIDLSRHKFAVLGAGAELSVAPLLLEGGASVLWIDVVDPAPIARGAARPGGSLRYVRGGADLLTQPREIARTISEFARDGPVHLALYAYAAGRSREWRLAAAMNAILRHLDPASVRSVSLLVSPTSPSAVQPEDREAASRHRPRWWQSLLEGAGALPASYPEAGEPAIARAIVPIQGVSYQGAQYIAKILAAESLAVYGLDGRSSAPLSVSANVAGVSRTRSLSHPVFEVAFAAAGIFGVTTFAPETTRWLNGLLLLHDVLNPEAPGSHQRSYPDDAARAVGLFSQQVHGGIYGLRWALNPCITAAAVIGLVRRPWLLWPIVRGGR